MACLSLNSFLESGYAIREVMPRAITIPIKVEATVIAVERHISDLAKIHFQESRVKPTGHNVTAVSYTHLDVYKRQSFLFPMLPEKGQNIIFALSLQQPFYFFIHNAPSRYLF